MKIEYNLSKHYQLIVKQHSLVIIIDHRQKYFANYRFLEQFNTKLSDLPRGYFDLLMYILLFGLEELDISKAELPEPNGTNTLVSYSGGVDSTALLSSFGGIAVHIYRSYQPGYEIKQGRAVSAVGAFNIVTNFEMIRHEYIGRHGFNVGVGYGALYIPLLPIMNANQISFGVVFDDLAFNYGQPFRYNTDYSGSRLYKIRKTMQQFGVDISLPLAGYSEVLTTQIADKGGIPLYSSCHTPDSRVKCLQCIKCFRKEGIRGRRLNLENEVFRRKIEKILKTHPIKMAPSTIYAIQKAGYRGGIFDRFKNISVTFCNRVNRRMVETFYTGEKIPEYKWMTRRDEENIKKFVEFINDPELYKK